MAIERPTGGSARYGSLLGHNAKLNCERIHKMQRRSRCFHSSLVTLQRWVIRAMWTAAPIHRGWRARRRAWASAPRCAKPDESIEVSTGSAREAADAEAHQGAIGPAQRDAFPRADGLRFAA